MSVGIFTWLVQYLPENRAILVQKLGEEKKMSKSVFGYLKVPMAIKLEGGGSKALMAWPIVEELFFATSLIQSYLILSSAMYACKRGICRRTGLTWADMRRFQGPMEPSELHSGGLEHSGSEELGTWNPLEPLGPR